MIGRNGICHMELLILLALLGFRVRFMNLLNAPHDFQTGTAVVIGGFPKSRFFAGYGETITVKSPYPFPVPPVK
jgi:hypothetical protein